MKNHTGDRAEDHIQKNVVHRGKDQACSGAKDDRKESAGSCAEDEGGREKDGVRDGSGDRAETGAAILWYRLRGLGLVGLCSLVFFAGAYINNQKSVEAGNIFYGNSMPVCSVQTEKKQAALTFDTVGDADVRNILDILSKDQIRAAFFVTGEWAENHPEEIRAIADAGHDIGSYGMNYIDMGKLTKTEINEELTQAHEAVQELTGVEMNLCRAPYGDCSGNLLETAQLNHYLTVQWDVDSGDWKDYGQDAVIANVTQSGNLKNGSVIRMHSGAKYTAQSLDAVIRGLQEMGYELVPVSQLVCRENYRIDENGRQIPKS